MTQDLAALVAKLRKGRLALLGHEIGQAADALEAQADEIARMTAALAEAEGAHWRVTPNTYTIPSEHPLGRTEADPMEGPGETYRDAYQRVLAERDTARAETAKWQADANLMLGFADLAYDVGAMPSSSELIAARDRVLAARDKATRERALREAASSIEGNTQERIALRRAILAKIKEADHE